MNYTVRAFKYLLQNFVYMVAFAVLPAILIAVSMDMDALEFLSNAYLGGKPFDLDFTKVFHAVSSFNFHSWGAFFTSALAVVAMVVTGSMLMAFMEKHMRIGKRTLNGVFSKVNDNLLSTCGICILFVLIYEIWALLSSAFLFVVSRLDGAALVYILSAVLFFGSQFVFHLVISVFYLWLPCMQITGFKAFEALRYSYQLAVPVLGKIAVGQFVGLTAAEILIMGAAYFAPAGVVVAVSAVLYTVLILCFCIRMQVVYFDRAGLERADLKKYYTI